MSASAVGMRRPDESAGGERPPAASGRPLAVTGTIAAGVVTASGLAVITMVVLVGWIAAPHVGLGLPSVLRTAAALWLVAHHAGFTLHGTEPIGMLPLGLVLLPGALLWRAGRWVVRAGTVRELRHVGYAAVALAGPYALMTAALAAASRSGPISASVPQAAVCGFLLALAAGGLGAAHAIAPWPELVRFLPDRARAVVVGAVGALAVLATAGALLAAAALASHLREAIHLQASLGAGFVGTVLLLLVEIAYVPNAVVWAAAFAVGPGFAIGTGTIVAPTGLSLGPLPAFPMLAAVPPGVHESIPAWLAPVVLALPYVAGMAGGWLLTRASPALGLESAPLLGLASGVVAACVLGLLAAFSGGPLGAGRLVAVGPSGWQVAAVSALEVGLGAAVTAVGLSYLASRRARRGLAPGPDARRLEAEVDSGHVIYVNQWTGEDSSGKRFGPSEPSAVPDPRLLP